VRILSLLRCSKPLAGDGGTDQTSPRIDSRSAGSGFASSGLGAHNRRSMELKIRLQR